jgi:hypothetical protein
MDVSDWIVLAPTVATFAAVAAALWIASGDRRRAQRRA